MAADPAESIVRIATPGGETLGTGFFCTPSGDVITCRHVVGNHEAISVYTSDAVSETVGRDRCVVLDDLDVAIIRTALKAPRLSPLTRLRPQLGARVWTKGFQYGGIGVTRAFPVRGLISGTTHIHYEYGSTNNDVLVFADAPVDHGLSGAPLIDERSGTIVGILLAKLPDHVGQLGGLALPLNHLDAFQEGRALLRENGDAVPAFGDFINPLGLSVLASVSTDRTLAALVSSGHFLPDLAVSRQALAADFAKFEASDHVVFPIVADSGKGKTFSLATLMRGAQLRQPAVFLRSIDFLPLDQSLGVTVSRALSEAAGSVGSSSPQEERLIEVVRRSGHGLLVVQDAINELPLTLRSDIEGWLTRTVDWLRSAGAKWVVSSRPDFWQPLLPLLRGAQVRVFTDEAREDGPEGHWLGDFDDAEARQAMKLYSMDERLIAADEARHPLLARAYWEASKEGASPQRGLTSRYAVFSSFVHQKVMAVARRTSSQPKLVRRLLAQAATEVCKAGQYDLPFASFHGPDLFGPLPSVAQQLVAEHVFVETGDTYRFAFETVAELLAAEHIWAMTSSFSSAQWERIPDAARISMMHAVSFEALRSEHEGRDERTRQCLDVLIAACQVDSSGGVDWFAFSAVSRTVSWLNRPTDFPQQMVWRLLRFAALQEHYYEWEPKHWHMTLSEKHGFGKMAAELFGRDAHRTIDAMLEWIGDRTSVGGGPTLDDVAGGLLYRYRSADVDRIYGSLADRDYGEFFYRLSEHEPAELLGVVQSWLRTSTRRPMALRCVGWLLNGPTELSELMPAVRDVYARTVNDDERDMALELLTRSEPGRVALFDDVLRRADEAELPRMTHLLFRYLNSRFDELYEWLERRHQRDPVLREETVSALANVEGNDQHRSGVVEIVARLWRRHPHLTSRVSYFIESRLYKEPSDSEAIRKLVGLAIELVRSGALEKSVALIYAATARGPEGIAGSQLDLVDEIIEVHRDDGGLRLLAQQLVLNGAGRGDILARIDKIAGVLSPQGLRGVLVSATIDDALASVLERWVMNGVVDSGSGWAAVLREDLANGVAFDDAVRSAVDIATESVS
jgi:hypothetical protein